MTDKQMEEKKEEFEHLSSLIRLQRKNLGESQDVYGKRFNVGGNAVSEWETAHSIPKYPILSKILWQWIEKLVEEVEESLSQNSDFLLKATRDLEQKSCNHMTNLEYYDGTIQCTRCYKFLTGKEYIKVLNNCGIGN